MWNPPAGAVFKVESHEQSQDIVKATSTGIPEVCANGCLDTIGNSSKSTIQINITPSDRAWLQNCLVGQVKGMYDATFVQQALGSCGFKNSVENFLLNKKLLIWVFLEGIPLEAWNETVFVSIVRWGKIKLSATEYEDERYWIDEGAPVDSRVTSESCRFEDLNVSLDDRAAQFDSNAIGKDNSFKVVGNIFNDIERA
ncbi:hypothetical protein V6N11_037781 [Hibiscus sabdariffa]|uniref:DUF4283 domain-containing protein n=1 Tax=Hibiscus sabdariffa TaxID=183260 RepID=A0ABR2PEI3_9ROSI